MSLANGHRLAVCSFVLAALLAQPQLAAGQSESAQALREARSFFALPLELDLDSGAANGNAAILRIMPLYSFSLGENWKLANLTILTLADAPGTPAFPGEPGAEKVAGASDLLHASFFTPKNNHKVIWGLGPAFSLPTATDEALGSEKWTAGPAFRFAYRTDNWNLGFVAVQRWSFAGTGNRNDVNQLLIRGNIRRQLRNNWYFVSAPLISANWDRPGQDWLIPAGGGIGRRFTFNEHPWAWSVQSYYNVVKADSDPDWIIRFAIVSAIPFGSKK